MDVKARLRSALNSLEDRDLSTQGHFAVKLIIDKLHTVQQAGLVVKELVSGLDKCGRSAANNRLLLLSYLLATQGHLGPLRTMPLAMPSLVAYVQRQHHSTNFDDLTTLGNRMGQALAAALSTDVTMYPGDHRHPYGGAGGGLGDRDTRQLPDRRSSREWASGGKDSGLEGATFVADPAWALNHLLLPLLRVACRGPERDAMAAACAVLVALVESLLQAARGDGSAGALVGRLLSWALTLLGSATAPLKSASVLQLLTSCVQALGPSLDADTAKRILLAATSGLDCSEDWQVRREAASLVRALAALGTQEAAVTNDPEAVCAPAWIAGPHRREFLMQALEPIRHDKFPAVRAAFQTAYATVARLPEPWGRPRGAARPPRDEYAEPRQSSAAVTARAASARRMSAEGDRRASAGASAGADQRGGGRGIASDAGGYAGQQRDRDWGSSRAPQRWEEREHEEEDEDAEAGYELTEGRGWTEGRLEPSFSERRPRAGAGTRGRSREPALLQASTEAWRSTTRRRRRHQDHNVDAADADAADGGCDEGDDDGGGGGFAQPSTGLGLGSARGRPQTPGRPRSVSSRRRAEAIPRKALAAAHTGGSSQRRRRTNSEDDLGIDGSSADEGAASSGSRRGVDLLEADAARRAASAGHTVHTFNLGDPVDVSPRATAGFGGGSGPGPRPGTRAWVERVLADDDEGPGRDYVGEEIEEEVQKMEEQVVEAVDVEDVLGAGRAAFRRAAVAAADRELGGRSSGPSGSFREGESRGSKRVAGKRFETGDDLTPGADVASGGQVDRPGRWRAAAGDADVPTLLPSKSPRMRSEGGASRAREPPRLRVTRPTGRPAATTAPPTSRRRTSPTQRHISPAGQQHQQQQRPLLIQPPWRCPSRGPSPRRARSQSHANSEGPPAAWAASSSAAAASAPPWREPSPLQPAAAGLPSSRGPATETAADLIYGGGGGGGDSFGGGAGAGAGVASRGPSSPLSRPPREFGAGAAGAGWSRFPAMEVAEEVPPVAASPSGGQRFRRRDTSRVSLGWPLGYRPPRGSPRFQRPLAPPTQLDFGVQIFAKEPPPQPSPHNLPQPAAAPSPQNQAPTYSVNVQTAGEGGPALMAVATDPGAGGGDYTGYGSPFRGYPGYGSPLAERGTWMGGSPTHNRLSAPTYSAAAAAAALAAAGAATAAAANDLDHPLHMTARVHVLGETGTRLPPPPHASYPYPHPNPQALYGDEYERPMETLYISGCGPAAMNVQRRDSGFGSSEDAEGTGSGGGSGDAAGRRGSAALEHQLRALVEQAQALQAALSTLGKQGQIGARRQRRRWDNQPGVAPGAVVSAWGGVSPLRGPGRERHPPQHPGLNLDTAAANAAVQQLQLLLQEAAGAQASLQVLLAGAGNPTNLQGAVDRLEELVIALQQGTALRGGDRPTAGGRPHGGATHGPGLGSAPPLSQIQTPTDAAGPEVESDVGFQTTGALRELIKQVEATRISLSRASGRTAQLLSAGAALQDDLPPGLSPRDAASVPKRAATTAATIGGINAPSPVLLAGHETPVAAEVTGAAPPARGGPPGPRNAWDAAATARNPQQGPLTSGRVRFELSTEGGSRDGGDGGSAARASAGTTAALEDIIHRTSSLRLPGEGPAAGIQGQPTHLELHPQQHHHLPPQSQPTSRAGTGRSDNPPSSYPPVAVADAYAADEGRHMPLHGSTPALAARWQQSQQPQHMQWQQQQQRSGSPRADRPSSLSLAAEARRLTGWDGRGGGAGSGRSDAGSETQHPPQRIIDFRPLLPAATSRPLVLSAGGSSTGASTGTAAHPRSLSPPATYRHPPSTSSPIQAAMSRLQSLGAALRRYDPRVGATGATDAAAAAGARLSEQGTASPQLRSSSPPLVPPVYPLVVVPRQPRYPAAANPAANAGQDGRVAEAYGATWPLPLPSPRSHSSPRLYQRSLRHDQQDYFHQYQLQPHSQQQQQQQQHQGQLDGTFGPFTASPSVDTVLAADRSHLSIMTPATSTAPAAATAVRPLGVWYGTSTTDAASAAASRLTALNIADDTATSRPVEQDPKPRLTSTSAADVTGRPSAVPHRRTSGSPHRLAVSSGPFEPPQVGSSGGGSTSFPALTTRSPIRASAATTASGTSSEQRPSSPLSTEGVAAPKLLTRGTGSDDQRSTAISSVELAEKEPMMPDSARDVYMDDGVVMAVAERLPRPYNGGEAELPLRRDPWTGVGDGGAGAFGSPAADRLQPLASPKDGLVASPRGNHGSGYEASGVAAESGDLGEGYIQEEPMERRQQGAEGEMPGRSIIAGHAPLGVIRGSTGDLVAIASVVELEGGLARPSEGATLSATATRGYGEQPPATPRKLEVPDNEEALYQLPTLSLDVVLASPRVDGDLATMFPATAAAVARQLPAEDLPPRGRAGTVTDSEVLDLQTRRDDVTVGLRTSYTGFGAMLTPRAMHDHSAGRRMEPVSPEVAVVGTGLGVEARLGAGRGVSMWPPLVPSAEPSISARSLARQAQGVQPANVQALRDSAIGLARSSLEAVREVEGLVVRLTQLQEQLALGRRVGRGELPPVPPTVQHDIFLAPTTFDGDVSDEEVFELPLISSL